MASGGAPGSGKNSEDKALNKSFDELSICDVGDEGEADEARKPMMTSTPVKSKARRKLACHFGSVRVDHDAHSPRGEKHDLTPSSKEHSGQPKSKRFQVGGKPSGKEVKERRSKLETDLKKGFVQEEKCEVQQSYVMAYLGLGKDSASLLTRAIKHVFPLVSVRRIREDGTNLYVNMRPQIGFSSSDPQQIEALPAEMVNIQNKLLATEEVMRQIWEQFMVATEGNTNLQRLLSEFTREARERDQLMNTLLSSYKKELAYLKDISSNILLSNEQKATLTEEIKTLEDICNVGVRSHITSDANELITPLLFKMFVDSVKEKCPLLRDIVECLVISNPHERNVQKTNEHKLLCGHHALALLLNVRNSNCFNDFPLLFGLLCFSYGAGKQFINMLQSIGLSLHFDTLKNYLSKRLDSFKEIILAHAPANVPVMLLMDNINMYRGNKRHHRLLKALGPSMWNFTVRGCIIPNCSGIDHLIATPETALDSQKLLSELKSDDVFIESNPAHLKAFKDAKDAYLVKLLDMGLNSVPCSEQEFASMSEQEFQLWLKKQDFKGTKEQKFKLEKNAKKQREVQCSHTLILPLSLENNATVGGTASVLEEFGKEFQIPCNHATIVLPFDEKLKNFDIDAARKHHEFMYLLQEHKNDMKQLEEQLTTLEKQFVDNTPVVSGDCENDGNSEEEEHIQFSVGAAAMFQKIDGKFQKVFDKLNEKMWRARQSIDPAAIVEFKQYLQTNREAWENARDHHGLSIMHHAVQNGNHSLVQTLLNAGVNPNVKERCGATPLTLAVITGDEEMVRILLTNYSICDDSFFVSVPGPKQIADKLELHAISAMIDDCLARDKEQDITVWEVMDFAPTVPKDTAVNSSLSTVTEGPFKYYRSLDRCRTLVVGDQGTNKVIRSVKVKSPSAYGWAAEVPGDMHARGYLYEVCKKAMGPGGFMCVAHTVMNRNRVTDAAFGDKKFQQQNLNRIDEAVRDVSVAYGLAAVQEFKASIYFPSDESLAAYYRLHRNHHNLLLDAFKEWIESQNNSITFRYQSQLFTLFGPLRELFHSSIKCGDGIGRETAWMVMLPLFAQLQKRNYWTEAFVHVVNFSAAWPLATRKILQNNCSVSVNGKQGHNIALDEWVETYLVQPLKNYASGHSSVNILKLLTVNLEAMGAVRQAFGGHEAFNVHPTTHHTEQDPFPDQLKGMWYCLREKFFKTQSSEDKNCIRKITTGGEVSGKVPMALVDVYQKGQEKIKQNFGQKLFSTFHVWLENTDTTNEVTEGGENE